MDWMTMSRLDDNGLDGLNWIRLATDWMMTIAALLTQFARSLGAVRIGQSGGLIIKTTQLQTGSSSLFFTLTFNEIDLNQKWKGVVAKSFIALLFHFIKMTPPSSFCKLSNHQI